MNDEARQVVHLRDAGLSAGDALATKETYKDEAWWRWDAMIKGGAVSKSETPATCIAKAAFGELYGWKPILSVNRVYLVDGRPCLAAEAMLGLIRERMPQAKIVKVHHDETRCLLKAKRDPEDEDWHVVEWTIDDAKRAGLLNKKNWQNYPKQMNFWRATSMLTRELFSDITLGCHTPEELEERPAMQARQVGPAEADDPMADDEDDIQEGEIVTDETPEDTTSEPDTTTTTQDDDDVAPTHGEIALALGAAIERYRGACRRAGHEPDVDAIAKSAIGCELHPNITDAQRIALTREVILAAELAERAGQ